jgi:hypothetical protein
MARGTRHMAEPSARWDERLSIRGARSSRRGFSVVEAVISALVVGLMLSAAIELVGASRTGQMWNMQRLRGLDLAAALMAEITDQAYADPSEPTVVLGPEAGEVLTGAGRGGFDDVDDYHGYRDEPPRHRDGSEIPGAQGWSREVRVEWINPVSLEVSLVESGSKRITITVRREGIAAARLVSVRSQAVVR